jgi:hypothetical protein
LRPSEKGCGVGHDCVQIGRSSLFAHCHSLL